VFWNLPESTLFSLVRFLYPSLIDVLLRFSGFPPLQASQKKFFCVSSFVSWIPNVLLFLIEN
jgi:hypothetical protein